LKIEFMRVAGQTLGQQADMVMAGGVTQPVVRDVEFPVRRRAAVPVGPLDPETG
jgi:hypothetical protein